MADVNLTQREMDYIARVVDTEVPRSLKSRNPEEYNRMVAAVTDTVLNRVVSERFPNSVTGVLNQNRQFSKITGPSRLDPYGSVQNTPRAPRDVQEAVSTHIARRAQGAPSAVGGSLNYANPNFSDRSNLLGWINPMIESGAQAFGVGQNVHYHGNAPGVDPARAFTISAESIPSGNIPVPLGRDQSPQARNAFGIMGAIDPVTVAPVERGLLAPPQPREEPFDMGRFGPIPNTENFDRGRFGLEESIPVSELAGALRDQRTALGPAPTIDPTMTGGTAPGAGAAASVMPVAATAGIGGAPRAEMSGALLTPDQRFALEVDDYRRSQGLPAVNAGLLGGPAPMPSPQAMPGYVDPMVTTQPAPPIQPQAPAPVGPVSPMPPAMEPRTGLGALLPTGGISPGYFGRNLLGGAAGGILGGMLLGPVGALAGGLLGREMTKRTYYPSKPKTAPQSQESAGFTYADLNDTGRSVYESSSQFQNAVDSGRGGLW